MKSFFTIAGIVLIVQVCYFYFTLKKHYKRPLSFEKLKKADLYYLIELSMSNLTPNNNTIILAWHIIKNHFLIVVKTFNRVFIIAGAITIFILYLSFIDLKISSTIMTYQYTIIVIILFAVFIHSFTSLACAVSEKEDIIEKTKSTIYQNKANLLIEIDQIKEDLTKYRQSTTVYMLSSITIAIVSMIFKTPNIDNTLLGISIFVILINKFLRDYYAYTICQIAYDLIYDIIHDHRQQATGS